MNNKIILSVITCLLYAVSAWALPGSRVEPVSTYPEFIVDGKPFFMHAAAFFYPRQPRDMWEKSLQTYKEMGINTIDLYIPWNWHEAAEGELDFDGHTNPRKDVIGLLRAISKLGLKAVIRPGPYVCAEWKNGGYPDWLLKRPEYQMAERSILEGRYPPLSSLQYPDPETAAKAWLENATHLKYTARWLKIVADKIINPFSAEKGGPVILAQLDDDQPAGNKNNGSYFWKYMKWLRDTLLRAGVTQPLFLNPPEGYVPALGNKETGEPHLWLMTQWYQRFYGVDLTTSSYISLEPAVEFLKTDPEHPPFISEFNAGFFAMESALYGMPTHPTNTLTASRIMIQNGLRGFIYFPLQDFLYPAGYEIPSVNPHYTWESALDISGNKKEKARSIERNGSLIKTQGRLLASAHKWADVALINPMGALDFNRLSTGAANGVESELLKINEWLIKNRINCDFVDPHNQPLEQLLRYPIILKPFMSKGGLPRFSSQTDAKLRKYSDSGGRVIAVDTFLPGWQEALARLRLERKVQSEKWLYASELVSDSGTLSFGKRDPKIENFGFLMIANLGNEKIVSAISAADPYDAEHRINFGLLTLPGKDALCLPIRVRISRLLSKLPWYLNNEDEVYSSVAEIKEVEADEYSTQINFYAPAGGLLKLRLKKNPAAVFLNGAEIKDFSTEPESGLFIIALPAGKAPEFLQKLALSYSEAHKPLLSELRAQAGLKYDFPKRINYLIRPDIALVSEPPLILEERGRGHFITLVLKNPAETKQEVSARLSISGTTVDISTNTLEVAPGRELRLRFNLPEIAPAAGGIYAGTITLSGLTSSEEIFVQVLRLPVAGVVYYNYDFDRDGNPESVLENSKLRMVVSPKAGGRIFQLVNKETGDNIVGSPGMLREILTEMSPLDTVWGGTKLPAWTRSRTPGLNTRPYSAEPVLAKNLQPALQMSYIAPDVPQGVKLKKTLWLDDDSLIADYELVVTSPAAGQEIKIQHVLLLDGGAELRYKESGGTQKASLAQDFKKNFNPKKIEIRTQSNAWSLNLDTQVPAVITAKKNYAVLELTMGKLTLPQTYRFSLNYKISTLK